MKFQFYSVFREIVKNCHTFLKTEKRHFVSISRKADNFWGRKELTYQKTVIFVAKKTCFS